MPMRLVVTALLAASSMAASAGYIVTGTVRGEVCRGFVITMCSLREIHAVEGRDGKLWTVSERFNTVSEYRNSMCWIRTKLDGWGLPGVAINAARAPVFYGRDAAGQFEKLDVETIVFPCRKE